jgi:hypothetical protein
MDLKPNLAARLPSQENMERSHQRKPGLCLSAEEAVFIAFEDTETARFLKTSFSGPEQKPEIITERRMTKHAHCHFWQVAIIEKPPAAFKVNRPLLNVAHVIIDAFDGKILQRWYLKSVFYEEYHEFRKSLFVLPEGCKGRNL